MQPPSQPPATMRAADADRERVAAVLQESYTEGRLGFAELQERLEQAYAAKTLGELVPLTADLPVQAGHTTPAGAAPAVPLPPETQSAYWQWARERILTYLLLMLFLVAIWSASGRHGSFWPVWPIVIGAFILGRSLIAGSRPGSVTRRRLARREQRAALRRLREEQRRNRRG